MQNEEILKTCGEHWRKIQGFGKNTPDIETLCRQMCGNYCRQISSKIDNSARLACIFEKTVFDFFSQCFSASFGIFWIDEEKYRKGFSVLDKKTPDIIITSKEIKSIEANIKIENIKMIIEVTTDSPEESMKKAWKDAFKYENCRGELIKHNVAVGFISLHGLPPQYLREDGESKIKNEGYGKDIPDYLDNNRWTYAQFLKVTDKENKPQPWWGWISNVSITSTMGMAITKKGTLIFPIPHKEDPLNSNWSLFYYLYNISAEILSRSGKFRLERISQKEFTSLLESYRPQNAMNSILSYRQIIRLDMNGFTKKHPNQ